MTFAEMLDERVRALPREGQRFLETLVICGRPMASELICVACGIARGRQSLVAMLRASHFIRSSGSSMAWKPSVDSSRAGPQIQTVPPHS